MIKPVDKIPSPHERVRNQREMIEKDILDAMSKGIKCFEFEGDYNYRYLQQYASEVASRMQRDLCKREVTKRCSKDPTLHYLVVGFDIRSEYPLAIFRSIKDEHQGKRVFCELNLDNIVTCVDEAIIRREKRYESNKT